MAMVNTEQDNSNNYKAVLNNLLVVFSRIDKGTIIPITTYPLTVGHNFLIFILKLLRFRCCKDALLVS